MFSLVTLGAASVEPTDPAQLLALEDRSAPVEMVGRSSPLVSASGKYELVNHDRSGPAPNHKVILKTAAGHRVLLSRSYYRGLEASWAPASDVLVINDFAGSNYTECIVDTIQPGKIAEENLVEELMHVQPQLQLERYIHVHVQAVKWLGPDSFLVRVRAWASPTIKGWFDKDYTYDLRHGFEL